MRRILELLGRIAEERGQTLVEYALILVFIAVAAVLALQALGGSISAFFNSAAALL